MTALSIDIARKEYTPSDIVALEGLRFNVEKGSFVSLVGPSGAGKSTLLKLILGIDRAFDGSIHFLDGGTRIGCVFQEPRLMPWLSTLENILLVTGDGPGERERARELITATGLAGFEDAFPRELSGGMQRRAALARAFAVQPSLLLMDEPFVSLDRPAASALRELLLDLWRETRPTILYVTHDLHEALALADRVVFIRRRPGRVVLDFSIDLPRPRSVDDVAIHALHQELLESHPGLLQGILREEREAMPDG
ncbi:ABC transporter ATP-binding protein [Chelativorans sp. YIM 93263]|uniref:ABC transporter ATP-binding protein n=1 Tax=Chelativorans sp. YIM 93263 TaxID=2906648 RepID=UPI0023794276|nr:ABC transporter ATP-binding protein [Chelativorans sp. YIM 93263]